MGVERVLAGSRWVVRDDGLGPFLCDGVANVVGVVSGIGDDKLGWGTIEQGGSLRSIADLASREEQADRAAESSDGEMNFRSQAAARASDRLILSPLFAPLACW